MTKGITNKKLKNLVDGLQAQFPECSVGYQMDIKRVEQGMFEDRFPLFKVVRRHMIFIDETIMDAKKEDMLVT